MTAVSVNDELYQRLSQAAAVQGKTVGEFVEHALQRELSHFQVREIIRNGLPVMMVEAQAPRIDPAEVRHSIEEAGF